MAATDSVASTNDTRTVSASRPEGTPTLADPRTVTSALPSRSPTPATTA